MKLSHNEKPALVSSGIESRAFGFVMNEKMYDLMLKKIYKNKPGAVIRELACNALDSHTAAGIPDTPFLIHLPTWVDSSFSIRDYGTGIEHDEFETTYTNVGYSTKEGSNEQVGAYGLGSKTPFTLTDTYCIENWRDGRKTTWLCFKDSGVPQVSKVADVPDTKEPSGLRVSFTFSDSLVSEFGRQVIKQLRFFPVKPILESDIEWPEVPEDSYGYMPQADASTLVMGNVAYEFRSWDIPDCDSSILHNLVIYANIGDVDVPPSRETLELTTKTLDYIRALVSKIQEEYEAKVIKDVGSMEFLVQAKRYAEKGNTAAINKIPKEKLILATGELVVCITDYWYSLPKYKIHRKIGRLKQVSVIRDLDLPVYFNDIGVKLKSMSHKIPGNVYILGSKESNKRKDLPRLSEEAIKDLKENHGIPMVNISTITGFPSIAVPRARGPRSSAPAQIYLAQSGRKLNGMKGAEVTDIPKDISYYVEIHGSGFVNDDIPLVNAALVADAGPVYLVRKKTVPRLPSTFKPLVKKKPAIVKELTRRYNEAFTALRVQTKTRFLGAFLPLPVDLRLTTPLKKIMKVRDSVGSSNGLNNYDYALRDIGIHVKRPEYSTASLDNLILEHDRTTLGKLLKSLEYTARPISVLNIVSELITPQKKRV